MCTDTYCISLPANTQRRKRFSEFASAHGWQWTWAPGYDYKRVVIDYRALTPDTYIKVEGCTVYPFRPDWHEPLRETEVAIHIAHMLVWREAARRDLDRVVIFEDDARITEPPVFEFPGDADLLWISDRMPHNDRQEAWGYGCGLYGYVLTRRGVAKMLRMASPLYMPIDLQVVAHTESMHTFGHRLCRWAHLFGERPLLKGYVAKKPFCFHDDQGYSVKRSVSPGWDRQDALGRPC